MGAWRGRLLAVGLVIFTVIELARRREDVVPDYAELLLDRTLGIEIDWPEVNQAIIDKWSPAGLRYIKERAYKLAYPGAVDRV